MCKRSLGYILIHIIKIYKIVFSPFFSPCCRFEPSCSEYAIEAVRRYGPFRGLYLGLKRLLRCHPLCEGGYDPVR